MFKRLLFVFVVAAFLLMTISGHAAMAEELTVMTRNMYLGAELAPVQTAKTQEEFFAAAQAALAQIAANNFPERAQALAAEIVEKQPHLVGLQEVYNFTFNGSNGPPPFRDHLADLMAALTAQGAGYRVAAVVKDMDIQVPLSGNVLGVIDRDVILARNDVPTAVVPLALSGCRQSLDGCNYTVVASAPSPLGVTIAIERGFVAVDAMAGNGPVRFVNTHLELRNVDPTNPLSPLIQAMQAYELVSVLAGFPNPLNVPVIVAGDFNSKPQDQTLTVGPYVIVPPYWQLTGAGFMDTWNLRPGDPQGLTCCQTENLLNLDSILYERIDVVFTSVPSVGMVKVNLVGNDETDKTPSGLWPSDHAGVVTRLEFAQ